MVPLNLYHTYFQRSNVWPAPPWALNNHLWGPNAHAAAKTRLEQAGPQLSRHGRHGRLWGHHPRCQSAVHSGRAVEQSPRLCQWHRMGPTLVMSHLHCWRWSSGDQSDPGDFNSQTLSCQVIITFLLGFDLGHPTDAKGYWGPNSGLHCCWGGDQPNPMGCHPTRLDRSSFIF